MQAVFDDAPVAADGGQQPGRIGFHAGERVMKYRVSRSRRPDKSLADDLQHLLDSGPADVVIEADRADQRADFDPARPLSPRGHRLTLSSAFTPRPQGKRPRQRLEFLLDFSDLTWVDCLSPRERNLPRRRESVRTDRAGECHIAHHHGLFQQDLRQQWPCCARSSSHRRGPGPPPRRPVCHQRQQIPTFLRRPHAEPQSVFPSMLSTARSSTACEALLNPTHQHPVKTIRIQLGKQVAKAISFWRSPGESQTVPEVNR